MKKIILSSVFLASSFLVNAQDGIKAGTISAGGAIGIQLGSGSTKNTIGTTSTSTDAPSTFGLNVLPNIQYFVADNFSVGLQVGIGTNSSTTKVGTTETSTSTTLFQVAPYARYYLMLSGGNVGFFGQGAVGITTRSGSTKSGTTSVDAPNTFTLGIGISPGIVFFPSSKIGIEAVIGNVFAFQSTSTTTKTTVGTTTSETVTTSNTIDLLNANTLGISFGFNYYFGR
jgi:hypothetical protein